MNILIFFTNFFQIILNNNEAYEIGYKKFIVTFEHPTFIHELPWT